MKLFSGFPAGKLDVTPLPNLFFSELVPAIDDLAELKVRGYAFQISLLHEALMNKAVVKEVPVEFVDRKRGQTKLGLSDIIEFMMNAWWIRFERSKTFLKFSVVGVTGVVVNLVSFTI